MQVIKIGVQNNGDKPIAGVSGALTFIDIFDTEVGSINFRITETVEPGKTVAWNGSRDYNQFIDSHRAIWNLDDGKYKTECPKLDRPEGPDRSRTWLPF
jgi:hypothetical protein